MNREPQVVRLAADHQIQGIDRLPKERTVLIPWERISIDDRVLAIAAREIIGIITGAACQLVVAGSTGNQVCSTPARERIVPGSTEQLVVARSPIKRIGAIAAVENIIAASGIERISAEAA